MYDERRTDLGHPQNTVSQLLTVNLTQPLCLPRMADLQHVYLKIFFALRLVKLYTSNLKVDCYFSICF